MNDMILEFMMMAYYMFSIKIQVVSSTGLNQIVHWVLNNWYYVVALGIRTLLFVY